MATAMSFHDVVRKFGTQVAVDGLTFDVDEGSVVSLLGPNGAGKTTSISMMLGLIRPTTGKVALLGKDPTSPANRKHIGTMLQQVDDIVCLKLCDNGHGIQSTTKSESNGGNGINGMRARVASVGGLLTVWSNGDLIGPANVSDGVYVKGCKSNQSRANVRGLVTR